jgi:hypothetical protein
VGLEAQCRARVTDGAGKTREAESTVLLETDELIVRGEARIRVPRSDIQSLDVRAGTLTVTTPGARVVLSLGADAAAKWGKKLAEQPKQLIDKLDVKPDAKVWLFDVDDDTLIAQVDQRTSTVVRGRSASECDVVIVDVNSEKELDRIERAIDATHTAGAVWVIHRKGAAGVADTAIFARAKSLGLVYTKVARVSDRDTAEKLVRPRAARPKRK